MDLNGAELGSRDVHTEDHAECRHYVRLTLEAGTSGADGEEVICVGCILGFAYLMVEAPGVEGVK